MLPKDALAVAKDVPELRRGICQRRCRIAPGWWPGTIANDALGVTNAPELRNGGGQGRSQIMSWRLPKVVPNVALVIAVGARECRHGCGKWRAPG